MAKRICVYCSSSSRVNSVYREACKVLGKELGARGYTLVFGGSDVGLMGALARSVQENGGSVVGVLPQSLVDKGIAYDAADELVVTDTMAERKAVMEERADAFVALPGGFGTLDEISDIVANKILGFHEKPLVLVNVNGFYNVLLEFFEGYYRENFADETYRRHYSVVEDVGAVFRELDGTLQ